MKKPLNQMKVAIATAAGIHCKKDPQVNLSGNFTFRELVPMGTNAGEPYNIEMQYGIVKEALEQLEILESPGQVVPLDYEYVAKV